MSSVDFNENLLEVSWAVELPSFMNEKITCYDWKKKWFVLKIVIYCAVSAPLHSCYWTFVQSIKILSHWMSKRKYFFKMQSISIKFKWNSNSNQSEYIDGIDLLNGCNALKSGANSTSKTIWLWPGWLNNCSSFRYLSEGS